MDLEVFVVTASNRGRLSGRRDDVALGDISRDDASLENGMVPRGYIHSESFHGEETQICMAVVMGSFRSLSGRGSQNFFVART